MCWWSYRDRRGGKKKKILKSKLASGPHESHEDPRSSLRRKNAANPVFRKLAGPQQATCVQNWREAGCQCHLLGNITPSLHPQELHPRVHFLRRQFPMSPADFGPKILVVPSHLSQAHKSSFSEKIHQNY